MSEWISVDDSLPDAGYWCLWLDGDRTMGHHPPFHHVDKIDKRNQCVVNYLHNYTHWMPLPPNPTTEEG